AWTYTNHKPRYHQTKQSMHCLASGVSLGPTPTTSLPVTRQNNPCFAPQVVFLLNLHQPQASLPPDKTIHALPRKWCFADEIIRKTPQKNLLF
ncbi:MAG: hypothetical protein WCK35_19850, partial [Chloroflexota bacterium]